MILKIAFMDSLETLKYKASAYDQICLMKTARMAVRIAKRAGLISPQPCEHCGRSPKDVPIYAHHKDYEKPLEIVWLCRRCHSREHVRLGWGNPYSNKFKADLAPPAPLMPPIPTVQFYRKKAAYLLQDATLIKLSHEAYRKRVLSENGYKCHHYEE